MEVLDVVDQSAGEVVFDLIDDYGRANVDELDVGVILLAIINSLINQLVVANAGAEILGSNFGILAPVVRRRRLDLADVVHDDLFIITQRFDK